MGFRFTGIAVSKNLQHEPAQMEAIIEKKLTFLKKIHFESAMSLKKPFNCCDIFFNPHCTIFFFADYTEYFAQIETSKANHCMITSFVASETSMTFYASAYKNGAFVREMWAFPDGTIENTGKLFEGEVARDDGFTIVLKAIQQTIGQSFFGIKLDSPAWRYQMA